MASQITLADIQAELVRMGVKAPPAELAGGKTADEWAEAWSCSPNFTRKILRKCLDADLLTVAQQYRTRIDGKGFWAPLYAFRTDPEPGNMTGHKKRKPEPCRKIGKKVLKRSGKRSGR